MYILEYCELLRVSRCLEFTLGELITVSLTFSGRKKMDFENTCHIHVTYVLGNVNLERSSVFNSDIKQA